MAKKWVLKTIGAAWKSYKHRIKLEHFYEYNDNKTRWQKRPKTVPDQGFLTLLKLWDTKEEKKDENPEKEPPSLAELFARTRRRKEGKQYADSYDDTAKLIEDMNNFKPPEENIDKDPFLAIMGENHDGRCRLYGRGVTRKLIKKDTGAETSYIVPSEVFGSFAAATELKKSYEKDKEALEELHREILADHEKRKAELDEFQKGLESQRAEIVQDAVKIVFAALPPEIVKKYLS